MSDDLSCEQRKNHGQDITIIPDDLLEQYTLAEIEKTLNFIGRSLQNYPIMPKLSDLFMDRCRNRLVLEEQSYDQSKMQQEHQTLVCKLNSGQKHIYDAVVDLVNNKDGGISFVYGSGGCGKTYLWNTIITRLRSERKIVLPVASSGIAATLLPGGRTAHSRFKIPLKLDDTSTCAIRQNSDIAELVKQTSLIIWDEAPMQNRHAFESLDRTLRDIMKSVDKENYEKIISGITVLLGGDFRKILPVITRGSRADIVSSCILRSPLWSSCKLFTLSENMRLKRGTHSEVEWTVDKFSKWVLDIGNGELECHTLIDTNSDDIMSIPDQFCIQTTTMDINILIDIVFPDLAERYTYHSYLRQRTILTPRNKVVDHVNGLIMQKIPGESYTYNSVDSVKCLVGGNDDLTSTVPVEILNSIKLPGMPPHELILKEDVVVMLLRNINQTLGLCNGTRMVVRKCNKHSVLCEIISGNHCGT